MSRKAIAVGAVAAVLTVSACSNSKSADIDGAQLMSKVSANSSIDKFAGKNATVNADFDFKVKTPESSKDSESKGDLEFKFDSKSNGFALDGKVEAKGDLVPAGNVTRSAKAYGEKSSDGGYKAYWQLNKDNWSYVNISRSDYQSLLAQMQQASQQQTGDVTGQINKFMSDAKQYANIDVKDDGETYTATVTPKDVVINELTSLAAKKGAKINKNDVKIKLVVTVEKKSYLLKELKADVDVKSTDGKFSIKGDANIKADTDKDVSIDIPKEAKDGNEVKSEDFRQLLRVGPKGPKDPGNIPSDKGDSTSEPAKPGTL